MWKKSIFALLVATVIFGLTACRSEEEEQIVYHPIQVEEEVISKPTAAEIRAKFEQFFVDNHDRLVQEIAPDGEEIILTLAAGNEISLTIILDDIELNDDNHSFYALSFGLAFPEMTDFFEEIATGILTDAALPYFRLTAIFADMHGEEIARSRFDVVAEVVVEVD